MAIGIPRALLYWKKPFFWEVFFENLGFDVLLSPETNKEIIEIGVKISDPETCFSQKVYWGHLAWLAGKCDLIFIPRLKATEERLEYCPKFFGIPDLAKILVKTPILTETFDERKRKFEGSLIKLGKLINKNRAEIKKAQKIAFLEEKKEQEKQREDVFKKMRSPKPKIVLVSHPYNLYDDYLNLRAREKLEKLGAEVIFIDWVPVVPAEGKDSSSDSGLPPQKIRYPKFHWEFGKEIMGKVDWLLKYDIAGAIEISSFQCGCDAVMKEFVESKFKAMKIPFLYIVLDEHTGEAGIQTRLEAFIDTLT